MLIPRLLKAQPATEPKARRIDQNNPFSFKPPPLGLTRKSPPSQPTAAPTAALNAPPVQGDAYMSPLPSSLQPANGGDDSDDDLDEAVIQYVHHQELETWKCARSMLLGPLSLLCVPIAKCLLLLLLLGPAPPLNVNSVAC